MREKTNILPISAFEYTATNSNIGADDYISQLVEDLKYPAETAAYLEAALQEGDREALLLAMRHVALAKRSCNAAQKINGS